jgi:hypothetical protein
VRAITHPVDEAKNDGGLSEHEREQLKGMHPALEGLFETMVQLINEIQPSQTIGEFAVSTLDAIIGLAHAIGSGGRLTAAEYQRLKTKAARLGKLKKAIQPGSRQSVMETTIREHSNEPTKRLLELVNGALQAAGHRRGIGLTRLYELRRRILVSEETGKL